MKIILAILLPPVAVLLCGKPIAFFINLLCCLLFWVPGIIHAIYVVNKCDADKRHREMMAVLKANGRS